VIKVHFLLLNRILKLHLLSHKLLEFLILFALAVGRSSVVVEIVRVVFADCRLVIILGLIKRLSSLVHRRSSVVGVVGSTTSLRNYLLYNYQLVRKENVLTNVFILVEADAAIALRFVFNAHLVEVVPAFEHFDVLLVEAEVLVTVVALVLFGGCALYSKVV